MSIDQSDTLELLGLTGAFPRPGWVVLDAARDRKFTGEVRFGTVPDVSVSFDRGHIYVAERVTEPSLGARLVDAGLLTASELERGIIRLGTVEHIGRLFERVPSLDRHAVTLAAEMLTDECLGWLAVQHVSAIDVTPYRQHPSGVLRWHQLSMQLVLQPGDPLPAPEPTDEPVESPPPPLLLREGVDAEFDDLIQWDEPGWLDQADETARFEEFLGSVTSEPYDFGDGSDDDEEFDQAAEDSGRAETAHPEALETLAPPVAPSASDEIASDDFEVIWPSGDTTDPKVPAADVETSDDDRISVESAPETPIDGDLPVRLANGGRGVDDNSSMVESRQPVLHEPDLGQPDPYHAGDATETDATETEESGHIALAVRRAVATIDTGSLASRRRLASSVDDESSRGVAADLEQETGQMSPWSVRHTDMVVPIRRSVFDDGPSPAPAARDSPASVMSPKIETERSSALRRLIGSLRTR